MAGWSGDLPSPLMAIFIVLCLTNASLYLEFLLVTQAKTQQYNTNKAMLFYLSKKLNTKGANSNVNGFLLLVGDRKNTSFPLAHPSITSL